MVTQEHRCVIVSLSGECNRPEALALTHHVAALHDNSSLIFGMPIIDADKATTVMAIKRSMNPGFAGIDNELYSLDHTLMLFGDAKAVIAAVAKELAELNHR